MMSRHLMYRAVCPQPCRLPLEQDYATRSAVDILAAVPTARKLAPPFDHHDAAVNLGQGLLAAR